MHQGNLKRNYFFQLIYEFFRFATPLITAPYISRILGAEGVGIYSYTASILAYFSMFAALGTSAYGARTIAQCRDDEKALSKTFWEIEIMTMFTSMVSIMMWIIWSFIATEYNIYFFVLTPHLFASMFNIVWFYRGLEKQGRVVGRDIFFKCIGIAYLFLFVKSREDLFSYILVNAIVSCMGSLSMWIYLPKILVKVERKTLSFARHFKETLVYFIPTLSISFYTVLDKTLIGIITQDVRQNGYYEQANKIMKMVKALAITSINSVTTVRNSYLFGKGKIEEAKRRIEHSLNYVLFLGYGAVFGLGGIAKNFVPLFFGEEFEPVITILYFKLPLTLLIGVSNCLGTQYYTPSGRRKDSTKYIIAGSCTNLVMNLLLIPLYGVIGAVVASLIAETTITILYIINCKGFIQFKTIWKCSWKRVFAGIFTMLCVVCIREVLHISLGLLLTIQMITGVSVYLLTLTLLHDSIVYEIRDIGIGMVKKYIFKQK